MPGRYLDQLHLLTKHNLMAALPASLVVFCVQVVLVGAHIKSWGGWALREHWLGDELEWELEKKV